VETGVHPTLGFWFDATYSDGERIRQYPEQKGFLPQRFDPRPLTPEEVDRDWIEIVLEELKLK